MLASNDSGAPDTNISTHNRERCHPYMAAVRPECALEQIPGARQTCSKNILPEMSEKTGVPIETAEEKIVRLEKEAALWRGHIKKRANYEMISKVKLKSLKEDAALGKNIKEKLGKQKFTGTYLGRKLIATALLHAPKLGFESASNLMALFNASFLADVGVLDLSNVPNSTPCTKTMRSIIFEATADAIIVEREKMQELPLSILADKGDGRGNPDGANFVKLIGKYNHEREDVDVTCIGIDSTGNDSKSAAENISHSLTKYDTEDKK